LVLGNLAQASFREGHIDAALTHAQRACALRVALTGEDGMPTARARMDFAVMLATAGRREEAMQLVQRAIGAVETHVGEEDPRLSVVLENAARIALSAGAAASAEPFLLRLHALLALHDESTHTADVLLARIAEIRSSQGTIDRGTEPAVDAASVDPAAALTVDIPEDMPVEVLSVRPTVGSTATSELPVNVLGGLDIDIVGDWEDQPLRDAVAITDVLLRTTPSGVPAIVEAMVETTPPEMAEAKAEDDDSAPSRLVLDFPVHHGVLDEEYAVNEPAASIGPDSPVSPPLELVDAEVSEPLLPIVEDFTTIPSVIEPAPVINTPSVPLPVETPAVLQMRPQRNVTVVLPAKDDGEFALESKPTGARRSRNTEPGKAVREPVQSVPSRKIPWLPVGGGVAAVAAAAAWWLFLR